MNISKCVEYFISSKTTPQDMRPRTSPLKIVPNFFSKDECDFFITLILNKSTNVTNGKELIFNSEVTAEWVWKRIKYLIPFRTVFDEHNDRWEVVGINPRFRIVRYFPTVEPQTYKANACWNSWNRKTFATGMVHLNSTSGGATHFPSIHTTVEAVEKSLVLKTLISVVKNVKKKSIYSNSMWFTNWSCQSGAKQSLLKRENSCTSKISNENVY